jgi:hypothetical protein
MADLTDEQRRALRILARNPNGCTDAVMMARGFEREILAMLVFDGLVNVEAHETILGRRHMKVFWLRITEAGRKAIAE